MRFRRWCCDTTKAAVLAALMIFGGWQVANAQSGGARRVVQLNTDGSSYLGIEMEDVTANNMASYKLSSERGVIVRSVSKGSPAEAAGLQANDVILEYAGTPVLSTMQLARIVRETPGGRKVDLLISREGKKLNISAKIGTRGDGEMGSRDIEITPGDGYGRQFNFRVPGPRSFRFRMPDDGWGYFDMPEGGRMAYSSDEEKARLGVTVQVLTDQLAEFLGVTGKKGAMVVSVMDGTPAAGKLKAGDVIIRADNKSIDDPGDLAREVSGREGTLNLTIIRDKKEMSVSVDLPKLEPKSGKGGYRL